ncbi:MAG TPA: T9SS type A sorting domain-containing protein, partial [Phaeodactylibacter sp.]|nr:T9SS type A sorting domain-containing protein [Phaeodactylibacter sp.]
MSDVSSCDPGGTCPDDDGDGVCNASDICPGFDDNVDSDGDGIPDGCDTGGGCTTSTTSFSVNPLTHSGAGSSSSDVSYSSAHYDIAFTISNIDAQQNGNPNGRYIEVVTVSYVDGNGQSQVYGSFSGASVSTVDVSIPGDVLSINVSLEDGYDGNSSTTMSVDLSQVTSCDGSTAAPSGGANLKPMEDKVSRTALHLFPNPANNRLSFNVNLPKTAFVQAVITDFKGKAVYQQGQKLEAGPYQSAVNVSELPAGVYAFHLMWEGQRLVKKFVIVR